MERSRVMLHLEALKRYREAVKPLIAYKVEIMQTAPQSIVIAENAIEILYPSDVQKLLNYIDELILATQIETLSRGGINERRISL